MVDVVVPLVVQLDLPDGRVSDSNEPGFLFECDEQAELRRVEGRGGTEGHPFRVALSVGCARPGGNI